jgi:triosephosphate isomerase (EC 5.3.1.1)
MKLIAGNWKMNKTPSQTREYITKFLELVRDVKNTEILLCPPLPPSVWQEKC